MHVEKAIQRPIKSIITKNKFLAYFLCIIAAFFMCLLLAFEENPDGWYLFTAALWIAAFGLVPYYLILFKLLSTINKTTAAIMLLLYITTSVGLFMAGLFQEGSALRQYHLLSAYIGFGGFFLAGIFTWILVGTKITRLDGNKTKHITAYAVSIMTLSTGAALFIIHLVLQETIDLDFSGEPYGPLIGFPFTEWLLVITIFVDKFLIGLIIASFLPCNVPIPT
jgi:hypothetical protein